MTHPLPEKASLIERLKQGGFNVPDFLYVPAEDFRAERFDELARFLEKHHESFKVIARSAHPAEAKFKGGTFDSLPTYADVAGIIYARKRMIKLAQTSRRLSILRQQKFNRAPQIDLDEMGVIVMPFIEGNSVMAKFIGNHWEFGYCRDRACRVQSEPYITNTPHDRQLVQASKDIQNHLGFRCEIEYIIGTDGQVWVVQAKDISHIEILEQRESERSILLDGIRRIRIRRSYRERPIFVIDMEDFYMRLIDRCEDLLHGWGDEAVSIDDILHIVQQFEADMENFALMHQRFAVLGICLKAPEQLYQIASHYLDETPELQKPLSRALHDNLYVVDYFISEADTIVARDRVLVNLGSHDAYGIDTVRMPVWSVFWNEARQEEVVKQIRKIGFKTGDTIGIDIDADCQPTLIRL